MDRDDRIGRESRLRAAVLAGDDGAWRDWYESAAPDLRAYVHWRSGGSADWAEDVVQEVWLTVIRRMRSFRPKQGPFAAWIRGIAANVIRNQLRKPQPRQSPSTSDEQDPILNPRWRSGSDEAPDLIARALAALPPHYEGVLRAKYLDGLSVLAIADLSGDSPKAVESLLTRARQAFREAYQSAELVDG